MSRTSPQNLAERNSPNVVREVLAFLMRHWRREAWCVAGIAVSMMVATGADLLLPVFSGRLVDAVASGAAHRRPRCARRLTPLRAMASLGAVLGAGAVSRFPGHRAADGAADDAHGQRCLLAGAALLHRLAREQLRRLDRAADHARHLGRRSDGRHAAAGAVAGGAGADRLSPAAGMALAGDGCAGRRGCARLRQRFGGAVAGVDRSGGAALECAGHAHGRRAGRRHHLQHGGEVLRRRGTGRCAPREGAGQVGLAYAADVDVRIAQRGSADDRAAGAADAGGWCARRGCGGAGARPQATSRLC